MTDNERKQLQVAQSSDTDRIFTLPNILRACNDVTYTMVTGVFAMFAFRIALGYVFGVVLGYGSVGVWVAMMGDWIFRTICYLSRYRRGTWRTYAGFASSDTGSI